MRNLKLTDITTGVGMPIKSGSLTHIQLAYKEVIDYLTRGFVGNYDNTKGYVLFGCENSGSGSSYVISSGAIFYNGEIYLVDAASFSTSGSNVPICTITTTYYTGTNADNVTFTDSVARSVHEIKKIVISSGASGSGTVNYSNLVFFTWKQIDVVSSVVSNTGTSTIDSVIWKYKRFGDIMHAMLTISGNVSGYNGNRCAFTFDLPTQASISDVSDDIWIGTNANIGLNTSGSVNPAILFVDVLTPTKMYFKMIGTTTGDFTVGCTLIYKI